MVSTENKCDRLCTYNGETMTYAQWGLKFGFARNTILRWLRECGGDYEEAVKLANAKGEARRARKTSKMYKDDAEDRREIIFKEWQRGERTAMEIAKITGISIKEVREYIPLTEKG